MPLILMIWIVMPTRLLQEMLKFVRKWQNRVRCYLLVDEYQDTNTAQYTLVKLWSLRMGAIHRW